MNAQDLIDRMQEFLDAPAKVLDTPKFREYWTGSATASVIKAYKDGRVVDV